jgi:hypothetical protein
MKRPKCKFRWWLITTGEDHTPSKRAIACCELNDSLFIKGMRCNENNCPLNLFKTTSKSTWVNK